MHVLVIILVLLLLFGGLPQWGYHSYGYTLSGLGFFLLLLLVILLLSGQL